MATETDAANPSAEARQAEKEAGEKESQAAQGAKDWAMIPFMIGGLVGMIVPELRAVYSEDRCLTWGDHANQVAEKYGWNSPSNMPELGLAACSLSFAVPTFLLLRTAMQQAEAAKEAGLLGKFVMWWKQRKAGKAAAAAASAPEKGAGGGGEQ